mmetsp:Transcript_17041/g.57217  ORF Transcript_17041/g.57217 Transcript_17041/m.57217 type:complete len:452 (-) Transcript_17041:303-1658(-)
MRAQLREDDVERHLGVLTHCRGRRDIDEVCEVGHYAHDRFVVAPGAEAQGWGQAPVDPCEHALRAKRSLLRAGSTGEGEGLKAERMTHKVLCSMQCERLHLSPVAHVLQVPFLEQRGGFWRGLRELVKPEAEAQRAAGEVGAELVAHEGLRRVDEHRAREHRESIHDLLVAGIQSVDPIHKGRQREALRPVDAHLHADDVRPKGHHAVHVLAGRRRLEDGLEQVRCSRLHGAPVLEDARAKGLVLEPFEEAARAILPQAVDPLLEKGLPLRDGREVLRDGHSRGKARRQEGDFRDRGELWQRKGIRDVGEVGEVGDVRQIGQIGQLREVGDVGQGGHFRKIDDGQVGQLREVGDVGQVGQFRKIGDVGHVGQLREVGDLNWRRVGGQVRETAVTTTRSSIGWPPASHRVEEVVDALKARGPARSRRRGRRHLGAGAAVRRRAIWRAHRRDR